MGGDTLMGSIFFIMYRLCDPKLEPFCRLICAIDDCHITDILFSFSDFERECRILARELLDALRRHPIYTPKGIEQTNQICLATVIRFSQRSQIRIINMR